MKLKDKPGYSKPYTDPEETEYRQLKDITPRAIFEKAWANGGWLGGLTNDFMQEFTRFVAVFNIRYEEAMPLEDLVNEVEVEPEWEKWLIQHGFIEKVVEKTWKQIKWCDIARLQSGIKVKRVYNGYEEIFTITKEPRLEYIQSFHRKEVVYDSASSLGSVDQHFVTDLFNGDVYILAEGK